MLLHFIIGQNPSTIIFLDAFHMIHNFEKLIDLRK